MTHKEKVTTDVYACARCGEDHTQLVFTHFMREASQWTHWASCPITKEPVLLKIVEHFETEKSDGVS